MMTEFSRISFRWPLRLSAAVVQYNVFFPCVTLLCPIDIYLDRRQQILVALVDACCKTKVRNCDVNHFIPSAPPSYSNAQDIFNDPYASIFWEFLGAIDSSGFHYTARMTPGFGFISKHYYILTFSTNQSRYLVTEVLSPNMNQVPASPNATSRVVNI